MVFNVNVLICLGLCLGLFGFWFRRAANHRAILVSPALAYFTAGVVVLALPLAYTTDMRVTSAAWRVAGIVLGLFWFVSCLQINWRRCTVLAALYGLLFLVAVQAVIAGQQWLVPDNAWVPLYGNQVYGSFFQPNVLASFIATGVTLTLALLLLPGLALKRARSEHARQCGLLILLAMLSAVLICIQSRAGWLGGIAAVLLLFRFGRLNSPRTVRAVAALTVAALTVGVFLGSTLLLLEQSLIPLVDHSHSNLSRWTMLRDTLAMIADSPWQGGGMAGSSMIFSTFAFPKLHQLR